MRTAVTVNNNSPIQDYVHPDDQTQPTFEMSKMFARVICQTFELEVNYFTAKEKYSEENSVYGEVSY